MAIYHCSIKIISRGKGKSAVAAAAYRAGAQITNGRDGVTHDYTRKYLPFCLHLIRPVRGAQNNPAPNNHLRNTQTIS